jgi:molecular chaperone GrpE
MARPHSIEDEVVATEAVDVDTLLKENASLRDRLLRALADAENTRRQASRTAGDARRFANADFARELLIVVDNLQRTIDAAEGQAPLTTENAAHIEGVQATLLEGVQATLRVLLRTLERFGVRRISALGERFDPNLHEAVMEVDDPAQPPGTVTQVVEQGCTMHDRLLRPARVVVSKRRAPTEPEIDYSDLGTDRSSRSANEP